MRVAALLVPLAASAPAALATGCDDDGDLAHVDAGPRIDGAASSDGGDSGTNTATKLGKTCASSSECPMEAPRCVKLVASAASGFCTLDCGTSTAANMVPSEGAESCGAQYDGASGTPLCGANDATMSTCPGGTCTWVCVVACGDYMGTPLGSCPNDLSCSQNACD